MKKMGLFYIFFGPLKDSFNVLAICTHGLYDSFLQNTQIKINVDVPLYFISMRQNSIRFQSPASSLSISTNLPAPLAFHLLILNPSWGTQQ